jgi:signal transduction histidine kinase
MTTRDRLHLPGRVTAARIGWLVVVVPLGLMLAVSLFSHFARPPTLGNDATLLPPEVIRPALEELRIPAGLYSVFHVLRLLAVTTGFVVVGAVIWWRASDLFALLVSLALVAVGVFLSLPAAVGLEGPPPPWLVFVSTLVFLSIFLMAYLFPDGRFVPRWTRFLLLPWLAVTVGVSFFAGSPLDTNTWPAPVGIPANLALVATCPVSLVIRYRQAGTAQRQQLKVAGLGIGAAIVTFVAFWNVAREVAALRQPGTLALAYDVIGGTVLLGALLLIPLTIGFAVLRYRLWDVDPIVNRALVYGGLTGAIVVAYVVAVGYVGAQLQVNASVLSVVAAAVVAILFQPLRERLQRAVNRLMYGRRDEPYLVVSQLSRRLESSLAPTAALDAIVQTVSEVLKLPYVAIAVREGDQYVIAASAGSAAVGVVDLPVVYQGQRIGQLTLAPRSVDEPLGPRDRQLLAELARQSGPAVHSFRLARDLEALTAELQQARVRLVSAREEERQRIHRDLHDGLGSALASLNLRAGAIRALLDRDSASADRLLGEQQSTIREAIADIRRLVHDLRPAPLDELGLVGAVRKLGERHATGSPVRVTVEIPEILPPLSAAVEVAVFRIAQEAIANVARHARAGCCRVTVGVIDEGLRLEVADDGQGLNGSARPGLGMRSMRERAEELGGSLEIDRAPGGGTRVTAVLPTGG